jgi:hypothetical protein
MLSIYKLFASSSKSMLLFKLPNFDLNAAYSNFYNLIKALEALSDYLKKLD